jgi:VanZ family protein
VTRWLVWALFVIAWTIALLWPVQPEIGVEQIDDLLAPFRYAVTKTLHVTAYAVLTLLTAWLKAPMRYRWLLVFFVMAHGTATEMGQLTMNQMGVSSRLGDLRDVAFDNLGVLIGSIVGWKLWTRDDAPSGPEGAA